MISPFFPLELGSVSAYLSLLVAKMHNIAWQTQGSALNMLNNDNE